MKVICKHTNECSEDCPHKVEHEFNSECSPCNLVDADNKYNDVCIPVEDFKQKEKEMFNKWEAFKRNTYNPLDFLA